MNDYVADNGVVLTGTDDDSIRWHPGISQRRASEALREYFQAERDQELGRWRDPENPDCICYPVAGDPDDIWVVYEGSGLAYMRERNQAFYAGNKFSEVARRYFAAHPEPKPWHAARPDCDEIWVLTIHGCEQPVYVTEFGGEPAFQVPGGETMSLSHGAITAGHRIWPEPRIGGAE